MTRRDLIRILTSTELTDHKNLTREQARMVVNQIFRAIEEALRNGDVARLPVGNMGVYEQERKPIRRWILNRVRVLYKQRNVIKFMGDEYDLEPTNQPPNTLPSKGEMKPSERNSSPRKLSPPERHKLIAIGIKAGKSRRLIAQELNVKETTIRRDMKAQGITANKKPTATRRKPTVVWKDSSPAISNKKVAPLKSIKPFKSGPGNKGVSPRFVIPEQFKPRPPKPEVPLSPEKLRQQHLEEMLHLVQAWLVERNDDYVRETNVLDKARNNLATHRDRPTREPESSMSAAQLRDHTHPPDPATRQNIFRREEACATWLSSWLAAWESQDRQLRNDVLDQVKAHLSK